MLEFYKIIDTYEQENLVSLKLRVNWHKHDSFNKS